MDLISGHVGLGYAIVCNRSQRETDISSTCRDTQELAFFQRTPWNSIDKSKVGVDGLKTRLDALLIHITRDCFEDVGVEISQLLERSRYESCRLGPPRVTPSEQRVYLTQMASRFNALTCNAIDAHYGREKCFRDPKFRLATSIKESSDRFCDEMFAMGATRKFGRSKSGAIKIDIPASSSEGQGSGNDLPSSSEEEVPVARFQPRHPGLRRVFKSLPSAPPSKRESIMELISHEYRNYRGIEIGSMNSSLLPSMHSEQTKHWNFFAMQFLSSVVEQMHDFIQDLLRFVCEDEEIVLRLWSRLKHDLVDGYRLASAQVEFLVEVENTGKLMTLNHYYADNVEKAQRNRLRQRLAPVQSWAGSDQEPLVRLDDIFKAYKSNDDQFIEAMHDSLKSYYKVARKRYVDAILNQAIGHYLISSSKAPLWLFSPEFVSTLSDEELSKLVADPAAKQERRRTLAADISRFERGAEIIG